MTGVTRSGVALVPALTTMLLLVAGAAAAACRVRHGERVMFEGLVRADPAASEQITVAVLSCNSTRTPGERQELVNGLHRLDSRRP